MSQDRSAGSANATRNARSTGGRSRALPGYGPAAKLILVLSQFVISLLMPEIGPGATPATLTDLHFSLGILILLLMAIRLVQRLLHPVPPEASDSPAWARWSAQATHLAFYFLLLVSPFLGWASASAHKLPVTLFGLLALPALADPRARWALTAGDIHGLMMWTLLALIALHTAAAIYHHFIRRDDVLRRMLPALGK
jgi:cytochrome b561